MKDENLIPYKKMVDSFKQYFIAVTFEQVPRINKKVFNAMKP
jgi:hypothetical protein